MFHSPLSMFLAILIGLIGFALFKYGRKNDRFPQVGAGLLLMVIGALVPGALVKLVAAAVVLALLWLFVQRGM